MSWSFRKRPFASLAATMAKLLLSDVLHAHCPRLSTRSETAFFKFDRAWLRPFQGTKTKYRVPTVLEKSGKSENFSRSVNCQGIMKQVREFYKIAQTWGKVREIYFWTFVNNLKCFKVDGSTKKLSCFGYMRYVVFDTTSGKGNVIKWIWH